MKLGYSTTFSLLVGQLIPMLSEEGYINPKNKKMLQVRLVLHIIILEEGYII